MSFFEFCHPFFINNAWLEAGKLKEGDALFLYDKTTSSVLKISVIDTVVKVYNITVDTDHDYFVTGKKVLVHNVDCNVPKGFSETKQFGKIHGQKVYQKGQRYISRDIGQKDGTSHNGGVWKEFKKSGNRLIRTGTLDENLKRFKD
ncbi:MAG: polymorphic toxin-type HINT domain-containing protein [Bacteroidota bacterium]|nr:polymorphic toxin-type HINT domain-containing protein [Bacteroidota bacterium]